LWHGSEQTASFKAHLLAKTLWVNPNKQLVLRDFGADSYGNALQHFGQVNFLIKMLFSP